MAVLESLKEALNEWIKKDPLVRKYRVLTAQDIVEVLKRADEIRESMNPFEHL